MQLAYTFVRYLRSRCPQMYSAHTIMQQLNNRPATEPAPEQPATPTLHELIRSIGRRTDVISRTLRLLADGGHTYSKATVYSVINRNGGGNATIERALLDAIAQEKAAVADLNHRRQALATT